MRSLLTGDESLQAPTHGIKPVAEAPDELELIEMLGALALRLALGAAATVTIVINVLIWRF